MIPNMAFEGGMHASTSFGKCMSVDVYFGMEFYPHTNNGRQSVCILTGTDHMRVIMQVDVPPTVGWTVY